MGFFDKAKELFSDGGVELSGQLTQPTSMRSGVVQGSVTISGKAPDTVKKLTISLNKRTIAQNAGQPSGSTEDEQIGITTIDQPGGFTPEQPLAVPFQLDFRNWTGLSKHLQSINEDLQNQGGVLGGLSRGLDLVSGTPHQYHYYLTVMCDVASRSFSVSKEIEVTVDA